MGLARARNFLYSDATWDAKTVCDLGVALKVVPDEDVDAEGLAFAHKLANGPAEVMGLAKTLLLKSFESSLPEMMELEGLGQALAMSSAEFREGLAALIEKRAPDYIGAATASFGSDGLPPSSPFDEPET